MSIHKATILSDGGAALHARVQFAAHTDEDMIINAYKKPFELFQY